MKSTSVTEICIFCHTPHNANPAAPLWNQPLSATGVTYQPYTSTTLEGGRGAADRIVEAVPGCHDGTVAIGSTVNNGQIAMQGVDAQGRMTGASALGTDLRDDHPDLVCARSPEAEIVNPPAASPVKLDANGQVQCRTCHDPHRMDIDPTTMKFLVVEQLGVRALPRLSQPAVLDDQSEHAQDLDQGLHRGAGCAHRLRDRQHQRVRELPQAAHRRVAAARPEGR